MFEVGKVYKITISHHEGYSYSHPEVLDYQHPLLKIRAHDGREVIYNVGSTAFVSAELTDLDPRRDIGVLLDGLDKGDSPMSEDDGTKRYEDLD